MPRFSYSGHPVQLSYSTNVHPARNLSEIESFLTEATPRVRALVAPDRPFGVCLHLAEETITALRSDGAREGLQDRLERNELEVVAINGFPLGDFHAPVVKANAYAPDWTQTRRRDLTLEMARIFAELLPEGRNGTISTLAGSYKPWGDDFTIHEIIAARLIEVAIGLQRLEEATGKRILVGLEPEPFTTLETGDEVKDFFRRHVEPAGKNAGMADSWRHYIGLNVDLCHHAVEFEDLPSLLDDLHDEGIGIGSVHASSALRIRGSPPEILERLSAFDEPRYLHQLIAVDGAGKVVKRVTDLPELLNCPPSELEGIEEMRCHFHVPLDCEEVGGLETTASMTAEAVRHMLTKRYCDAVVAETYTWGVGPLAGDELPDRLAGELNWLVNATGLER